MPRLLNAVADRVVVSPLAAKTVTDSGIHLGSEAERPLAVVLSVGDSVDDPRLAPGRIVMWRRNMGVEFDFDGLSVASLTVDEIVGVVDHKKGVRVVFYSLDEENDKKAADRVDFA